MESAVKLSKGLTRTLTRLYAFVSGCTSRVCFRLKLTSRELFYILEGKYTVALAVGN